MFMPFQDTRTQCCLCFPRRQGFSVVYVFLGDKDSVLFMPFYNTRIQGSLCLSRIQGF